ncbi:MAG: tetratricopeptide repeat protein [Calditerrivibrio sp.]|uniref:tetratricopeptide repeat protein n=1 Tax=Calditerrivibrio nitroreducens TaxID=477976 RepID=UPI003C753208
MHAIASLLLSNFLIVFLPKDYKKDKKQPLILTFLIIFSTFIIGFIASIIIYTIILRKQEDYKFVPIENVSYRSFSEFPKIKRVFGESAARSISEFPKIKRVFGESAVRSTIGLKNYKIKLLSIISTIKTKETLSVVQNGIGDENDEIRLTSFSIINKFTSKINNIIKNKIEDFEKATDNNLKSQLAKDIAIGYWDLVYYGLSDKELEKYVYSMIEHYTNISISLNPADPEIIFIKGKLSLFQNNLNDAEKYLNMALQNGYQEEKIYPYLAELYFYKRDYLRTKEIINKIALMQRLDPKLQAVINMWMG